MLNAPTVLRSGADDRMVRSWWRHEQRSIAATVATMLHHSAGRKPQRTMVNAATQVGIIHFPMTDDSSSDPDFAASAPDDACDEQVSVTEYVAPAPDVTYTAPAPVIEYVPDDAHATPASLIQHIVLAPEDTYAVPAPLIEHVSVAPVSQVNRDTRGLVNPQFSTARVEVTQQEIPEVQVIERAREHIAFAGQIDQEQIVAPIPQFQEQFVESVQKTPQGRLPERFEEPIENTPIEDILPAVPVIEHVTSAPDAVHAASHLWLVKLAPALESSSSSAAHAAATRNDDIDEKLTSIINVEIFSQFECGSSSSTAAHAAPVQAPSKRRRRTQFAPLPGALQDTVFLAPDAWPPVRHA